MLLQKHTLPLLQPQLPQLRQSVRPLPQDFAFLGLELFQTINKIKPTKGNKNPNTANPPLGASLGFTLPAAWGI
jgi:hypothetical protein